MLKIDARTRDLGGFSVGRVLPFHRRRMVGPFIFFDHLGPVEFAPGTGMDVRPHPHIGLATVTYLFEGHITHRDSLGNVMEIGPGAVNWMTAGRGISHSERTPDKLRASGQRMHGIQTWVALPLAGEDAPPAFVHHPADTIPAVSLKGASGRVIAGNLWGVTSPVSFAHPIVYAELHLRAGADIPLDPAWGERAVYLVAGAASVGDTPLAVRQMLVLDDGDTPHLRAAGPAHVILCGGAPMDGERFVWWNFVASSEARLVQAASDWRAQPVGGRFGAVPGEHEHIPAPPAP